MAINVPLPTATQTPTHTATGKALHNATVVVVKTGGTPLSGLMIGLGIALIVLIIAVLAVRRLKRYAAVPVYKELENAVKSRGDAVGVFISMSENRPKFVSMYRAGNIYVYEDRGGRKWFIPTINKPMTVGKKPVYFGIEYDRNAIEADPEALAAYGIARAILPEEIAKVFDEPYDEKKGLRSILSALSKVDAKITGKIKALEGVAFEVYPVEAITSMIRAMSAMNRAALHSQVGLWESIEKSGKVVAGKAGILSNPEAGKNIFWIAIALGVLLFFLMIMRGLKFGGP